MPLQLQLQLPVPTLQKPSRWAGHAHHWHHQSQSDDGGPMRRAQHGFGRCRGPKHSNGPCRHVDLPACVRLVVRYAVRWTWPVQSGRQNRLELCWNVPNGRACWREQRFREAVQTDPRLLPSGVRGLPRPGKRPLPRARGLPRPGVGRHYLCCESGFLLLVPCLGTGSLRRSRLVGVTWLPIKLQTTGQHQLRFVLPHTVYWQPGIVHCREIGPLAGLFAPAVLRWGPSCSKLFLVLQCPVPQLDLESALLFYWFPHKSRPVRPRTVPGPAKLKISRALAPATSGTACDTASGMALWLAIRACRCKFQRLQDQMIFQLSHLMQAEREDRPVRLLATIAHAFSARPRASEIGADDNSF